ncbi:hypothetical protein [Methylobacterium flocculans]|uniref:hypothetical protein n=1 Tax=Methylobacterium flocculans TaxID=2984843 RepID=UPI0021F33DD7|nr:hypothetical protein [Methylobacterium sp. FF17]
MIPYWPADLPQRFQRDGYSRGFADGRLSTPMEAGPPKTRRRFSSAIKPVTVTLDEREDAFARLERFYEEEVAGGSLPFLIPDQTRDALPLMVAPGIPLLDEQGRPLLNTAWWLVMFGGNLPTPQDRGGGWYRSTFSLSVLP